VIIDTPDALLISNKDSVQDIKKIVSQIKAPGRNEHYHRAEHWVVEWGTTKAINGANRIW